MLCTRRIFNIHTQSHRADNESKQNIDFLNNLTNIYIYYFFVIGKNSKDGKTYYSIMDDYDRLRNSFVKSCKLITNTECDNEYPYDEFYAQKHGDYYYDPYTMSVLITFTCDLLGLDEDRKHLISEKLRLFYEKMIIACISKPALPFIRRQCYCMNIENCDLCYTSQCMLNQYETCVKNIPFLTQNNIDDTHFK